MNQEKIENLRLILNPTVSHREGGIQIAKRPTKKDILSEQIASYSTFLKGAKPMIHALMGADVKDGILEINPFDLDLIFELEKRERYLQRMKGFVMYEIVKSTGCDQATRDQIFKELNPSFCIMIEDYRKFLNKIYLKLSRENIKKEFRVLLRERLTRKA
ncbi:hypothetical protein HYV73_03170 [Candidatus Uhrbacteria bacterium]|nr:hypothetical protein [Candidatus Uhrbacteria bacterium]